MLLASLGVDVFSYEINPKAYLVKEDLPNLVVFFQDCFQEVESIKALIEQPGRVMVLCDGGDKITEFDLFSGYLKEGDVIMCHDFGEHKLRFKKLAAIKKWGFAQEVSLSKIQDSITRNGLIQWKYEIFERVFWGSFKKGVGNGER